ncbi:class II fructose-bisphosphate aldolase [bacterium]|nr:class II fructose-bisphosphate aldolase [bacterium]
MTTKIDTFLEKRPENVRKVLGSKSKLCVLNSADIFSRFLEDRLIFMACNIRIKHVVPGIMKAAQELDAILGFELAKSEGGITGGYTGQTPRQFVEMLIEYGESMDYTVPFFIHADHISVKDTSENQLREAQELIQAQLEAGFSSFAIDASHNELPDNIEITLKLVPPILKAGLGLEVEVGEIAGSQGKLTTVEEALEYISTLKKNGVNMNLLAISNGSKHGNYDPEEEVHIDLERTGQIYDAIKPYGVSIAQHGITGTPLHLIGSFADYGIRKGNVGTNWQNIAHQGLPENLMKDINKWVQENGQPIKKATKVFKEQIDNIPSSNVKQIQESAYHSALDFIKSFRAQGSASLLFERLRD